MHINLFSSKQHMLTIGTVLRYYKRKDIQEAIVEHARDREVAPRYNDQFGSRPDMLQYATDILEFAKKNATSFHCSEERWKNPLQLSAELKQHELAALRSGWDLVIDVDCKSWELSKLIAYSVIDIIKSFGISAVSVKFSGNKGFHIGVPFEAFPARVHGKDVQLLFPDGPRRIAQYIIHILEEKFSELLARKNIQQLAKDIGLKTEELLIRACTLCGEKQPDAPTTEFVCTCGERATTTEQLSYKSCTKCGKLMIKSIAKVVCTNCNNAAFQTKLDTERILEIDTLLISSRHLYRAPYSLHEKSGLVSLPILPEEILTFDKKKADPDSVKPTLPFISRTAVTGEASSLFLQAFDYTIPQQQEKKDFTDIDVPDAAISAEHFPDCIKKISEGMRDGKKRALFILINFLRSVGWSPEQVEKYVMEWNKKNPEPLRENYLTGQLRYTKTKHPMLPPNCSNIAYYQSLGCKCADNICSRFKNPVNIAKVNEKRRVQLEKPKRGRKTNNPEAKDQTNTQETKTEIKAETKAVIYTKST